MLDAIIEQRAKGNPILIETTKARLALRGFDPKKFTNSSPDDPALVERVKEIAAQLGTRVEAP